MTERKKRKTTTISAVIHEDGRPALCEYHRKAILWEVAKGPCRGIRGCDACLHPELGTLKRDLSRLVCYETDKQIDAGEEMEGLPLFGLGQIVATPGALKALQEAGQSPDEFIDRHVSGDWGDLEKFDRQQNERAIREGLRVFSVYRTKKGKRLYVITELDRSATTILLPAEY